MQNATKGTIGEMFVRAYLTKNGYTLLPEKRNGSDIVAQKGKRIVTIEVKTTSNTRGGIPDMHQTEFVKQQGKWYLVADFLYVVRLDRDNTVASLDILTKKDVDAFAESHKTIIGIRTTALDRALQKGKVGKTVLF